MDVQLLSSQNDLPIAPSSVENIVSNFISFYKLKYDEVSIHFVDTETICDLHGEFFNDPSITDCISFPMDEAFDEGYLVMGDIFICPKTAITYTTVNGGDAYQETTLYLVHGLLHLIGYDDIDEADEKLMRQEESNFFNYLNTKKLALHS